MERETVSSSTIVSIGYDPVGETLEVEFHRTGLYQYFNVPISLYESLMAAPSLGVFFNANIRGQFAYARL